MSTSDSFNIYQLLDRMSEKGWSLTGLQRPAGIHVSPTLRHAQPGVAERFVADLKDAVALVRENPDFMGGMAPIYGLAATVPDRSLVHGMLQQVMDVFYRSVRRPRRRDRPRTSFSVHFSQADGGFA